MRFGFISVNLIKEEKKKKTLKLIAEKKRNSTLIQQIAELRRRSDIIEDINIGKTLANLSQFETQPIMQINESDEDADSGSDSES